MTTSYVTEAPSVLVVDDEEMMRELARIVLESSGFVVVDEAADGPEALERYSNLAPPPDPGVVLLDHRMPGMTGLEVAEQILARNPKQLIILFSAYVDASVVVAARDLGVSACVSKADVTRLPGIIRQLVDEQAEQAGQGEQPER